MISLASRNPYWERYRSFIRGKTRVLLTWVFVVLLGFFAKEYPTWPGILFCFGSATLRLWASGYLRKDTRPAVGGPYGYVRNPLFLGTYGMAVGIAWAIQSWGFAIMVTAFFVGIYMPIIWDEEAKLHKIFGDPYEKYGRSVPRLCPRLWPVSKVILQGINSDLGQQEFSWKIAIENKAYEAYVSFIGLMGYLMILAYIWKNFFSP